MKKILLILLFFTFIPSILIYPITPSSGLPGIAVSPDGKTIAVGGISRVIYILDSTTLTVVKRIWVKTQVLNLAFSKTGSVLVSENRDSSLNFFNMKNFSLIKSYSKLKGLSVSVANDEAIAHTLKLNSNSINFYSMKDGALIRSIPVEKKVKLYGVDSENKRLIVLRSGKKNIEKKISRKLIPKNLKGIEKQEYIQKNDGKVSVLTEYDLKSGKKLSEKNIFFTVATYSKMKVSQNSIFIFSYGNTNAKISKEGKIAIFRKGKHYNYGIGISVDSGLIATGGLRSGAVYNTNSDKAIFFKISSILGWPEYFKGFAFAKDGRFFATTSAFRIIEFDSKGKKLRERPVF